MVGGGSIIAKLSLFQVTWESILNIFENCAESLVRNFDLWLYNSTAGKQSPSSICRREHLPVGHLELLELLDSSLMSS